MRGGLQGISHIPYTRDAYWEQCCEVLGYICPTKEEFFKQLKYIELPTIHKMHISRAVHRILVGGNRAGKTYALAMECIAYLLWLGTSGWYASANYQMAEEFARKLQEILINRLGMERVLRNDNLQPWQFTYSLKTHVLNMGTGSTLELKSCEAPNSMHAVPLDYIILDEAALVPYILYDTRLVPRLVDNGGWILSAGTFESFEPTGEWFEEFYDVGQQKNDLSIESWMHPTADNFHEYIAKGGETSQELADIYSTNWSKIEKDNKGISWPLEKGQQVLIYNIDLEWLNEEKKRIDPDIYAARYEAARATSPFIVFPTWESKKFIQDDKAEFDPELPVYLCVDPGGTYAVLAVQLKQREDNTNTLTKGYDLCLIDELYYQTTVTTAEVFEACSSREWWPNLNRKDHAWWPVMQGAIDATANEQYRVWLHLGREDKRIKSLNLSSRKGDINAGIETLQHFLDTGSIWVHSRCRYFAMEMRKYQHQSPGFSRVGTEDPRKKETPKDAWNHLIKAAIYFITCKFGYYGKGEGSAVLTREKINELYHLNTVIEGKHRSAVVSKYR